MSSSLAISGALMPLARYCRALAAWVASNFGRRPPRRPFAAAAARPARVRSPMTSRSSWAKAAMMVSIARPIAPSVVRPSQRAELDAALVQVVDDLQHVLGIAGEAVEFPDGQDVAGAQVVQARGQLRAVDLGAADAVVGEDPHGAGGVESVELESGVLVRGAHACVSDEGHCLDLLSRSLVGWRVARLPVARWVCAMVGRRVVPGRSRDLVRDRGVAGDGRLRDRAISAGPVVDVGSYVRAVHMSLDSPDPLTGC